MTDITIFGEKRMTVKEVSVVLGTAESTIRNKVALLFPEVPQNGKPTLLDEYQITAIKKSLVPHDLTLKSKLENTSTDLEMARKAQEVMAWMAGKVSTLEAQLAEAQPKVAFFDAVCESKDTIEMGDVAKILNIPGYGRNNLFAFLREKKILMYDNAPYQTFIDRGYFRVIEGAWTDKGGSTHPTVKTMVYQKGMDFIRRAIQECLAQ